VVRRHSNVSCAFSRHCEYGMKDTSNGSDLLAVFVLDRKKRLEVPK
jgi:hypothetical protein